MSNQVLTTKLYTPMPRANRVARARLVERLEAGLRLGRPLSLISAPAGFGKTTLASDWINTHWQPRSVAWLSLDESDNELGRFCLYLVSAFQTIDPSLGLSVLPALQLAPLPPAPDLLLPLLNDLAASGRDVVLVLDDYHLITAEPVHQAMRCLLEHQPPRLHTLIVTREDPPLPLPRWRARNQLTEIRERELRFTPAEVEQFLKDCMSLELPAEAASTLGARTEGWIAGLQLAALAIQTIPDADSVRAFLAEFAGSDRFVVDYLMSEVLQRAPQPVSAFLVRTSILERLCAPLCDALMEAEPGAEVDWSRPAPIRSDFLLEQLERSNLFLIPLDNQRMWYRYHHLFREFLQAHLHHSEPSAEPTLHRRASLWYAAQGLLREAVEHALATRDWLFAADLVERHAMPMLGRSQVGTLRSWLGAFPESLIRARPGLCIFEAWSQVLAFRQDSAEAVERRLAQAEAAVACLPPQAEAAIGEGGAVVRVKDWTAGHVATLRSQLLLSDPHGLADPAALIALSRAALARLPDTEQTARSVSTIDLAHAYMALSDVGRAEPAFAEALQQALDGGNGYTAVTAVFYQARIAFWRGQLGRLKAICAEGRQTIESGLPYTAQEFPALRGVEIALSCLYLEQNDLAAAEATLARGLDLAGWASWMEVIGYANLARLREIEGDEAGVLAALGQIEKMGPQFAECATALRWRHQVIRCQPTETGRREASAWAEQQATQLGDGWSVPGLGPLQCDLDYLTWSAWAWLQLEIGQPRSAVRFVEPTLAVAHQRGLTYRVVEMSMLLALIRQGLGDEHGGWDALRQALQAAEAAGLVRVFDQGPALRQLLEQAAERHVVPGYAQTVLAALWPGHSPKMPDRSAPPQGPDPVSERELEVLQLIAAGLSNAEIGARLVIAQATVKRHINNLYSKLDVGSRTQAIDKARRTGLLM